jgi:hypothetical protein
MSCCGVGMNSFWSGWRGARSRGLARPAKSVAHLVGRRWRLTASGVGPEWRWLVKGTASGDSDGDGEGDGVTVGPTWQRPGRVTVPGG